ncbi:hypothetical protein ACO0K2_07665 [Undibacterium sp. MH2W]|uniref:hypothetical protein n=1 Tax=Undibacterium sp. MH2W TaxID=3413044 RepID=UPI003BF3CE3B
MKSNHEDGVGIAQSSVCAAPKSAPKSAKKLKQQETLFQAPTRKDLATLAIDELRPWLISWMCTSNIEWMPSKTQILDVLDVLRQRDDAADFLQVMAMCRNYIQSE